MKKKLTFVLSIIVGITIYVFSGVSELYTDMSLPKINNISFEEQSLDKGIVKYEKNKIIIKSSKFNVSAKKIIPDMDRGFYLLSNATFEKSFGILLLKFNSENQVEWGNIYKSSHAKEKFESLGSTDIIVTDTELLILGDHKEEASLVNAFVLSVDLNGKLKWSQSVGERRVANGLFDITKMSDGYMATGKVIRGYDVSFKKNRTFINPSKTVTNTWVVKFDKEGKKLWEEVIETDYHNFGVDIRAHQNQLVVYTAPVKNPKKILLSKDGKIISEEKINKLPKELDDKYRSKYFMKEVSFGRVILDKSQDDKFYIKELSEDKETLWSYSIDKTDRGDTVSIIETEDDGYLINNFRYSFLKGSTFLIKLDKDGKEVWQKNYFSENGRFVFNGHLKRDDNLHLFIANESFRSSELKSESSSDKIQVGVKPTAYSSGIVILKVQR